jgi:hypothetical protein
MASRPSRAVRYHRQIKYLKRDLKWRTETQQFETKDKLYHLISTPPPPVSRASDQKSKNEDSKRSHAKTFAAATVIVPAPINTTSNTCNKSEKSRVEKRITVQNT